MHRLTPFLIVVIVVLIVFYALSGMIVNELKGGRHAIVHLKPGVAKEIDQEGEVTTGDKYLSIKRADGSQELFTWDQIVSVTEKEQVPRKFDRIVDQIDLLSKLGIILTIGVFVFGFFQYRQGQKWEQEKFLAATVKEYVEQAPVRNATLMLDSLALYPQGRKIELFPDATDPKDRKVTISNTEIYKALTTRPDQELDPDDETAVLIRDCFDDFLSYLVAFYHYIDQGLITKDALTAHIGYWIELLGPKGKLSATYKSRVLGHARAYDFVEVERLLKLYQKRSWLPSRFNK